MSLFTPWSAVKSRAGASVRGAIGITSGTAAGQVIFLLISPLLTRLYSPTSFGLFTVLTSLIAVLAVVATLRLEIAIPLAASNREARRIASTSVIAAFLISLLFAGALAVAGGSIAGAFVGIDVADWLWVVPISAFAFGVYEIVSQYAVRRKMYGLIGKRSFVQSLVMSGAQLGLGFFSVRGGMLLGQMTGKILGIVFMLPSTGLATKAVIMDISVQKLRQTLRSNWRSPLLLMPSALLNTLGTQLPFLLIGFLYGAPMVGLLGLTQRILAAPASLIGQAVSNVFMGESAKIHRSAAGSNYRIFLRTSTGLAIVGVPFFGAVFMLAPEVFELVFGPQWKEAGLYAQAMCLSFLLQFAVGPVSQTLVINGAQSVQLMWDAGRVALVAAVIMGSFFLGADALATVWAYSVGSAIAYVILWLLCFWRAKARRNFLAGDTSGSLE